MVTNWPAVGVVVGKVRVRLEAKEVVASNLTVVWLVVEPVLKIKLAAEALALEPSSISPATWSKEEGVTVPMPMLPALVTLK